MLKNTSNGKSISGALVNKRASCDFPYKTTSDAEYSDDELAEIANEEIPEKPETKNIGDNPKAFGFKK